MQTIERTGVAEVLLPDDTTAPGTYHVVIERSATVAKGIIRLEEGHSAPRVMGARRVRVRFNGKTELLVSVYLYIPAAGFIAFTSPEAAALTLE